MGKHKAILVEKNGDQLKYKLHDKKHSSTTTKQTAASVEDSDKSIPVLTGSSKSKNAFSKKRPGNFHTFKPLIVAIISALIIGSALGFFLLRLFVDVEGQIAGEATDHVPSAALAENNAPAADSTDVQLDSLQAHVLQAGIFSEEANAVEWTDSYLAKGVPTMIWEKDDQYFLLAGIAATKEEAAQLADSLKAKGSIEIYVKEWSTSTGEVRLTESEQEWILKFQEVWNNALAGWTGEQTLSAETWNELAGTAPENSETLTPLLSAIKDPDEQATQLLQMMYYYEQLKQ